MSQRKISNTEAVEAMLDFFRSNLVLRGLKEEELTQSVVFTGFGAKGTEDETTHFALEVATSLNPAMNSANLSKRIRTREHQRYKTHTGVVFPQIIGLERDVESGISFVSRYLIPTTIDLRRGQRDLNSYLKMFFTDQNYRNCVTLTKAERLVGNLLRKNNNMQGVYYDPNGGELRIVRLRKYKPREDMPDDYIDSIPYNIKPKNVKEYFERKQRELLESMSDISLIGTIKDGQKFTLKKQNRGAMVVRYKQ